MTNNTFISALLRYKLQWLSASLVALVSLFSSCNREETFLEPTRIGEDKITRLNRSANVRRPSACRQDSGYKLRR